MALKKLTAALPERTDPADATLIYRDEPLRFARPRGESPAHTRAA